MLDLWGSHWKVSVPCFNVTFQVCVPLKGTPVFRLTPAPRMCALGMPARSRTSMLYAPGPSDFTTLPAAVFSEIVKAGPTVSTSFVAAGFVVVPPPLPLPPEDGDPAPTVKVPRIDSAWGSQKNL